MHLRGIDVGNRWEALADRWKPHTEAGNYAFNDFHAMMAFACAGRNGDAQKLLQTQEVAIRAADDNAGFLKDVGFDATKAIWAFHDGQYGWLTPACGKDARPLRTGHAVDRTAQERRAALTGVSGLPPHPTSGTQRIDGRARATSRVSGRAD